MHRRFQLVSHIRHKNSPDFVNYGLLVVCTLKHLCLDYYGVEITIAFTPD